MKQAKIALVGDYSSEVTAHIAIPKALAIASEALGQTIAFEWLNTGAITDINEQLRDFSAVWCVPASPYKNMQGALAAIRYARENDLAFLGTCGGYQHAILEYAHNALGLTDADNSEVNPNTSFALINPLSCSLIDKDDQINLVAGTKVAELYSKSSITEQYRCSYGFNQTYLPLFEKSDLVVSGYDLTGEVKIMELKKHPFFIGTGFQPERSALKGEQHPVITAFVKATLNV